MASSSDRNAEHRGNARRVFRIFGVQCSEFNVRCSPTMIPKSIKWRLQIWYGLILRSERRTSRECSAGVSHFRSSMFRVQCSMFPNHDSKIHQVASANLVWPHPQIGTPNIEGMLGGCFAFSEFNVQSSMFDVPQP